MDKSIQDIMTTTLSNLKCVMDSENITSKPIVLNDGTYVIPLTKISVGIVSGGGEYMEKTCEQKETLPFAGGGGGGLSITPLGFLVCSDNKSELIKVGEEEENKWKDLIVSAIKVMRASKK